MVSRALSPVYLGLVLLALSVAPSASSAQSRSEGEFPPGYGPSDKVVLPKPFDTPYKLNRAKVIGWPERRTPAAPVGFRVNSFADGLDNPRSFCVLPNGDVLVAESAFNPTEEVSRISLLRDANKDGVAEIRETLLTDVKFPFGLVVIGKRLYVGNNDSLVAFPFEVGQTKIAAPGTKIMDLPNHAGHWTRNLTANADNSKIYIAIGSSSNANENGQADNEPLRAAILEINPDGSGLRVFANGLRNPVGMGWEPATRTLWTVVNERNGLGDDLAPDYLTSVRQGTFYGWPYAYFGKNEDPTLKVKRPDLVAKSVAPDYALGAHTASLGLVFYTGASFPQPYQGGAFIGQHGSAHRSKFLGFKVAFLPFRNGKPNGSLQDFLTGFIASEEKSEVYGRPVNLAVLADGSLLVADDGGNRVWRVSYTGVAK